ncbi:MAG: hypothetical protein ACK5LK_00430 [Chthoniobacterales bacterium]
MKALFKYVRSLCLVSLLFAGTAFGAETALKGLAVVKKNKSSALVAQLVEINGRQGGPQPDTWTFLFNDSEARGGVREIEVFNGAIDAERTPLSGFSGVGGMPVLQANDIETDSSEAFQIANKEATKSNLGFHWVDYALRTDAATGRPIWALKLLDYRNVEVGNLALSASDGSVVSPLRILRKNLEESASSEESATSEEEGGGAIGAVGRTAKKTSDSVRKGTLRIIGNVQEWFTGKRTIGNE